MTQGQTQARTSLQSQGQVLSLPTPGCRLGAQSWDPTEPTRSSAAPCEPQAFGSPAGTESFPRA